MLTGKSPLNEALEVGCPGVGVFEGPAPAPQFRTPLWGGGGLCDDGFTVQLLCVPNPASRISLKALFPRAHLNNLHNLLSTEPNMQ